MMVPVELVQVRLPLQLASLLSLRQELPPLALTLQQNVSSLVLVS